MQEKCKKKTNNTKHYKAMRLSFYEKLINSLEKVESITLDERQDKSDAIVAISQIIRKRGGTVTWNKTKWSVKESGAYTLTNITYDTDGVKVKGLPKKMEIFVPNNVQGYEKIEQFISDEISNRTGFCHLGFATTPEIPE